MGNTWRRRWDLIYFIAGESKNSMYADANCTFAIMNKQIRITFLLIALVQGLHSIEEYAGRLWDVYPPATFICGLVSPNLKNGFIIINVGLFIVLMLIWLATFSKNYSVTPLLWFWTIMETVNGIGHSVWSITERSYTPGLATAPILLILALNMARLLIKPVYKNTV
jgi:Protein of unknown function with HXXEE motif